MAISGNLRTMPFADLMQWISMSRKTGTLVIKGTRFTKKILFHDGMVSAVTSNNPREHLGYFLVGWGFLTEEELKAALEAQREHKVMLGELLVRSGRLTREEVDRLVQVKTEQLVYELMLWEEGEFFFVDEAQPRREFLELQLPVDHFLFEGARQADERRRIAKLVPDSTHVPTLAEPVDSNAFAGADALILAAIDGVRSMEEIALACRVPVFYALSVVHRLLLAGKASLRPPRVPPPLHRPSEPAWRAAQREAENALAMGDLLEAFRQVQVLRGQHAGADEARAAADAVEREIDKEINTLPMDEAVVLELAIPFSELTRLQCGSDEGFVLSRVTGQYTMAQTLQQLPGSPLYNRVIIHSFIQRGVVKLRESRAVARVRQPY